MQNFIVKTFRPEVSIQDPHFFILNKGYNSGKPLTEPCPNCFTIICSSESQKEHLYWIAFCLWQLKRFHPLLKGSVIVFISISDLRSILQQSSAKIYDSHFSTFQSHLQNLQKLEEAEVHLQKKIKLIGELKKSLLHQCLNPVEK
ncbi:MAG: hypothetical protein KUL74_02440 [Cloacibacterium sp.]|nr:hypothetical protein [Cloacibacterium sp.]